MILNVLGLNSLIYKIRTILTTTQDCLKTDCLPTNVYLWNFHFKYEISAKSSYYFYEFDHVLFKNKVGLGIVYSELNKCPRIFNLQLLFF